MMKVMTRSTLILISFFYCWLGYFPSFGVGLEGFRWRNTQLYLRFPSIFKGTFLFENDKYPPIESFDSEFKPPKIDMTDNDGLPLQVDSDTDSVEKYDFLPLLPESTVAFPGCKNFLFINEMKFRELFSDMNKRNDQRLIRCFVREDGGVEPLACICRVKESRPLVSGECMYIIEAEQKVRIDKLVQEPGRSFLMAYCLQQGNPIDDLDNIDKNEKLSQDLFNKLKVYMRLERVHREMLSNLMQSIGTPEELEGIENQQVYISESIVSTSPIPKKSRVQETNEEKALRHVAFCDAVATLMSHPQTMQELFEGCKLFQFAPETMQTIFESSIEERTKKLSTLLDAAAERKKQSILAGPGSDNAKEAAIAAVSIKGMGEGDFLDYGEELFPPSYMKELSLNQLVIAEDNTIDSFVDSSSSSSSSSAKNDGMLFKADDSSDNDNSEGISSEEKEVDPFDDLENAMQ